MSQIFVIFFLFAAISLAVPPTIVSSVYKEKTIPFSGKYSTYRVHEVEFDQDIYLATNWACDCVDAAVNNCSNKNTSTLTTTQPYTTLQYDTWSVNHSLSYGDGDLFAFTVDQSIYSCPNIDIIHNTHWGAVALAIGNTAIPSSQSSDFVKHFASGDRIRICNSDPRFRYGTYFVYVYLYAPTVGFYDIKFKLSQSSNCNVAEIPNYNYVGASYVATPLFDSVMEYINFDPATNYTYQYEMKINQRCTNISINNRAVVGNIQGFMTVSFSNPNTNLGDQATWPYLYNGAYDISNTFSLNERNIVIPNFCVQGALPYSVFIGLQCSAGAPSVMTLLGTTDNAGWDLTPLAGLGMHQTMYSVGTQAFTFMCGADKKDDNTCPGTSYSSHFGYVNGIPSCAHINPMLSAEGMSPNFPRTGSDVDYGFYDFMFQIDFPADFVRKPNAARYPKRVSVVVYVEGWSEATNEYMRFINHPYDTCALTFFNKFMNQYYELPVGAELLLGTDLLFNRSYIPGTPYVSTVCDAATAKSLVQQRSDLLNALRAATTTLDAQYIELQLSILHAQDTWIACENYLDTFFNQSMATVAFTQQAVCTQNYNSDEFFNDACCDWGRNEILYCPAQDLDLFVSQPQALMQNMSDQCQYPQCVAILSVPYIATQQGLLDPVVGCNAKFVLPNEGSFVSFIYQCQVDTVGDDLQGSFCSSDADCKWGGSCVNGYSGLRCNHTANDVLTCFANSIDPALAQYMFSANNIAQQFTPAAFIQNFQNLFITPDCYGPNSKVYQEHFHYGIKGNCIDGCTFFVDCFAKTNDCPVPTCNSVGAGGVGCSRSFSPVAANQTACVEEFNCNWFDCTAAGLDAATCQAWCKNSSIPDTVCLDCSSGTCKEIPSLSTDEAGCNTGYCSSDPTIHDPVACAALTRCTVLFPQCSDLPIDLPGGPYLDAASCAAVGQCSSQCLLGSYVANGGICFEGRMEVGGPTPFCNPFPVGESFSVGAWACVSAVYNDSVTCESNTNGANVSFFPGKNIWKTLATTEAECVSEMSCYQPVDPNYDLQTPTSLWGIYMNETDCASTGTIRRYNLPHVWKPVNTWQNGTFSRGFMIPYLFVNRSYAQVRTIAPVMNFTGFRSAVLSALSSSSNIIRSSYETCLYDSVATFLGSVACDCQGNTSSDCYTATTPVLAQLFVCPFIESEAITPKATVTFYNNSVSSTSTCNVVTLYAQSINLYVAPTGDRLTSEIFYYQRRNVYSIVTNLALIQGQTISNLLEVSFPPALVISNPFEVCIDVVEGYPIDPLFTQYDIGILRQNPIRVQALGVGVTYVINTTTAMYRVCGNVTESGYYFAILVNPNFNEVRNSMIIQCAFSSFLFLIALVIATYYVYCFFFYYVQVRLYFKCILSVIIWFFCIIRMVYWIVVACGGFDNVQPASLVLFELPTFLFLVMFSCVVYLWADFQVKITKLKPMRGASEANRTSCWLYPFLLFQLIKIICVVILLIVYYTIPDPIDTLPCVIAVPVSGGNKSKVSLAYAVVIAFFGLLTAVSGLVIAARFTKIVFDMEQRQTSAKRAAKKKVAIYTALIVGGIFAICFFVKSAVFIAFVVVQTVDFPIIVFTILEIIPTFALMFYIAPARTPISDSSMYTTYFSRTTSTRNDSRGAHSATHSVKHTNVSLKMTGQGTDSSTPSTATKKADDA